MRVSEERREETAVALGKDTRNVTDEEVYKEERKALGPLLKQIMDDHLSRYVGNTGYGLKAIHDAVEHLFERDRLRAETESQT